jgi:tetratricopeptide (TPR) repeat protein
LEAGRFDESLTVFKPLAFDGNGEPQLTSVELYFYATVLMNQDRNAEAQELFEAAIRVPQKEEYFHYGLADCLLSQNKETERACGLVESVISNLLKNAKAVRERTFIAHAMALHACALASSGRHEDAEARIQEAWTTSETFDVYNKAALWHMSGVVWQTLGDKAKAREAFQQTLTLFPYGGVALRAQKRLAEIEANRG